MPAGAEEGEEHRPLIPWNPMAQRTALERLGRAVLAQPLPSAAKGQGEEETAEVRREGAASPVTPRLFTEVERRKLPLWAASVRETVDQVGGQEAWGPAE